MNKKILFGSIFAAFLMISISFVSVAQEQQATTTQTTELMTMEALIKNLQELHDGCKEHFADEFEDGFLEEFQNQIDILNETSVENPYMCSNLEMIYTILGVTSFALIVVSETIIGGFLFILCLALAGAVWFNAKWIYQCEWTIPDEPHYYQTCNCDLDTTSESDPLSAII